MHELQDIDTGAEFPDELPEEELEAPSPPWRRWVKRAVYALVIFLLLFIFILQLPVVQNAIRDYVIGWLSARIESAVHIERVAISGLDELRLESVFIADYTGDTLISAGVIYADINLSPFVLFSRGLEVEAVEVKHTRFYVRRPGGRDENTLQYVIRKLSSPEPSEAKGKPVSVNLKQVVLEDIQFIDIDSMAGKRLSVYLGKGQLRLNDLDLPRQYIDIASARLSQPLFRLDKFMGLAGDTLAAPAETAESKADSNGLWIKVEDFRLEEGGFSLHDYRRAPIKTTPADELDFRHLDVYDIAIDVNCFAFRRDTFSGEIEGIALKDLSGFVLNKLSSKETMVSPRGISLVGLSIETPYSQVGDTLQFKFRGYESFEYFNDEVKMDARLHDSQVALRDIMTFAVGLQQNKFFRANRETVLQIDGRISGEVNNLSARRLSVQLPDGTFLAGDFSSRNLAVRNEEFINLGVKQLSTSMRTLRQLLPGFNPPSNYDKLGAIDFSGRFDGFLADFVALGKLRTNIGAASMDMRMNLKPGSAKATYSGKLDLINFDLGALSGNKDLGRVNFTSTVKNGRGLTGKTASADLTAEIESLVFRGYKYQNAALTGKLNRNFFNGDFAIKDQNIDFAFTGEVNMSDTATRFDFLARVERLDMKALNLSPLDLVLAGDVRLNLRNRKLSNAEGEIRVTDLGLTKDGKDSYEIDSLVASSFFDRNGQKVFKLASDVAQGEVRGTFDLGELPQVWQQYLLDNFPGFASRLRIKPPRKAPVRSRFTYELNIVDSKGLNWLIDPKLGPIVGLDLEGSFNGDSGEVRVDMEAPGLQYADVRVTDFNVFVNLENQEGEITVKADSTIVGKTAFNDIILTNLVVGDSILFGIIYDQKEPASGISKLAIDGAFMLADSARYRVELITSNLSALETTWNISRGNAIVFGKKYLDISNFSLTNGKRQIILEDSPNGGIALKLKAFEFGLIDSLWSYQTLNFGGRFDADIQVGDVFNLKGIRARMESDSFYINGEDFGRFSLDAEAISLRDRAQAYLSLTRDTMQLIAEGFFNLGDIGNPPREGLRPTSMRKNFFDLSLHFAGYPLRIAEYWLAPGVSDTQGHFDADLRVAGMPGKPDVSGQIHAQQGAFTIDFLKTRYHFASSIIKADNTLFSASGTILRDKYNNQAVLTGGISHNRLKDLGLRASLRTSRFLALDLKKGDNDLFYGTAIGEGQVRFSGSFQQPDIYVRATTGDSTRIVIPISESANASALDVRFVNRRQKNSGALAAPGRKLTGLNLEMDLTITDKADMQLIFDEQAGDIIRGNGRGNIRMLLPRTGDFEMYGDYNIEQGNYLFTLYNIVNKDFRIRRGGRIVWSGDPFRAQIKLEAEYKDLQASLSAFIAEYLANASPDVRSAASASTNVALTLQLEGDLLKPNINFDIAFPQLVGQLANYADNKLRLLKQDQNELNRQVFGLIVVGQFLPADLSFRGSQVVTNTLSEFFSNQLTLLLNEFVAEVWGEDNAGFNLDFAYNQYTSFLEADGQQGVSQIGRNGLELTIRKNFLNDRLSVQLGGNVDFANNLSSVAASNNGAIWGNDFALEYVLNDARTLKLRVYQRRVPDIGGGRRLEIGSGLGWRREYGSFQEFWDSFKRQARTVNNTQG